MWPWLQLCIQSVLLSSVSNSILWQLFLQVTITPVILLSAVKTFKSLMNLSWGKYIMAHYLDWLPSQLMGKQFRGLLPFFKTAVPLKLLRSKFCLCRKQKNRFDKTVHDLPVIAIGATVSYLNYDQKPGPQAKSRAILWDHMWYSQRTAD